MADAAEWNGTYDGLTSWEKILVSAGYETGYEQCQRDRGGFTDHDVCKFAEVIRRKRIQVLGNPPLDTPIGKGVKSSL